MIIKENFDLTEYNSYRIKATCRKAYFPETEDDILALYRSHSHYILLGSGNNVILSKSYYDYDFVVFNGNYDSIKYDRANSVLEVEAGASMYNLSQFALDLGLSGLEIFYDIPSSLGGAIVMNAGASGEEIKDVLVKVRYLDLRDTNIREVSIDNMVFEYRNSLFQKSNDKVVLKAWIKLVSKDQSEIKTKMELVKMQRWAKQPKELPNAGSVFKRPKGFFVGVIMDELCLKGYTIGGAKISEKHGGFIVNFNNATGADILEIISHVQSKVKERYGITLEVEQRIL